MVCRHLNGALYQMGLPCGAGLRNPRVKDSSEPRITDDRPVLYHRAPRGALILLRTLALAAALALMGCDAVVPLARQVSVLDGQIHVRAPQFYCVDTQSARGGHDMAVVLIGRCTGGGHVAAALVTVTIGRSASAGVMAAGVEALRAFMSSPAGRRALARSGKAEDIEVLESGVVKGRLLLHLNDREAGEYWRAVLGIQGRLVTISASGAEGAPLSPEAGRKLVDQTIDALIKANPAE